MFYCEWKNLRKIKARKEKDKKIYNCANQSDTSKTAEQRIFIVDNPTALSTGLRILRKKRERECTLLVSFRAAGRPRDPLSGKGRNEVISVGLQSSGQCSQKDSLQLSASAELRCYQSGVLGPDPFRPRGNPFWPQGIVKFFFIRILFKFY